MQEFILKLVHPYDNLRPEWARFSRKAVFKAGIKRDNHFVKLVRLSQTSVSGLICLSLIMWREWATKSENYAALTRHLSDCIIGEIHPAHFLFDERRSVEIGLGVPNCHLSKQFIFSKLQIRNITLAVVLPHYICCISVHVVRPREQTIFSLSILSINIYRLFPFLPSDTFSVIPTRISRSESKFK